MGQQADIIVIGAGVIGLSCAWRLAQKGKKVTVFERGLCGSGASLASLGVLSPHSAAHNEPFHILHRRSLAMCRPFISELESAAGSSVPFARCGALKILVNETNYANALAEIDAAGKLRPESGDTYKFELLDPKQVLEIEPETSPAPFGGLLNHTVAVVEVTSLIEALIQACKNSGIGIIPQTEIQRLKLNGAKIEAVEYRSGAATCDQVLVCAGAWTSALHPLLGRYSAIQPVRGQALEITAPSLEIRRVIKSQRGYLVPGRDGCIALGSTTELESGFGEQNTFKGLQEVWAKTSRALPAIRHCRVTRFWTGLRPAAPDRKLYLGRIPETENLFVAGGHYKIGFGFAPLTAQSISELMTSEKSSFNIETLFPRIVEPKGKHGKSLPS